MRTSIDALPAEEQAAYWRGQARKYAEDLARYATATSWVRADLVKAEKRLARVAALQKRLREEKNFAVSDALREALE